MKNENSKNAPEAAKSVEINVQDYYEQAKQILEANSENLELYKKAQELLEQISGYKNSAKLLQECNDKILAINLKKDMAKRKKKKMIRNIILGVAAIVVALLVVSAVSTQNSENQVKFEKALEQLEKAEAPELLGAKKDKERNKIYRSAYTVLRDLGREDIIFESRIKRAKNLADDERYDAAIAFINDEILAATKDTEEAMILTQAMTEAIDDAYAYIDAKILERANEKLAAKDYYGALALYRYLDVEDENVANSVKICQTEPFKTSKVGDVVKFGTYEVNCKTGDFDEDVEWIILAKEGNKYLLVSKYVIDAVAYNTNDIEVVWGESTIRSWLNGTFVSKVFNDDEFSSVNATSITEGDVTTEDKVFLLSKEEADKYLTGNLKVAFNSKYAYKYKNAACYEVEREVDGEEFTDHYSAAWWLRTTVGDTALSVNNEGKIAEAGHQVDMATNGVRPAIWVTID